LESYTHEEGHAYLLVRGCSWENFYSFLIMLRKLGKGKRGPTAVITTPRKEGNITNKGGGERRKSATPRSTTLF